MQRLQEGLTIDGIQYQTGRGNLGPPTRGECLADHQLAGKEKTGKSAVCVNFCWEVSRLLRLSFGPFQLGNLLKGEAEQIPRAGAAESVGHQRQNKDQEKMIRIISGRWRGNCCKLYLGSILAPPLTAPGQALFNVWEHNLNF
ncbi:MAG: hypothetical protein IPP67_00035 [Rhodospirillaceae bacterium]|nr:hypothetical protein [Rhodospirillaceae bacterium]